MDLQVFLIIIYKVTNILCIFIKQGSIFLEPTQFSNH